MVLRALVLATLLAATVVLTSCGGGVSDNVPEGGQMQLAQRAILYAQHCQSCHGDLAGNGNDGVAPLHNQLGHTFHHADA